MRTRIGHVLAEAFIWYAVPLVFLALYVIVYHQPAAAIVDHLYAITLIAGCAWLLKAALYRFVPRRVALAVSAWLYATIILALVVYYALVVIGLRSWGRVITEGLIVNYALQAPQLCEAVGVSFLGVASGLVLAYLLAIAAFHVVLRKYLAVPLWRSAKVASRWLSALLVAAIVLATSQLREYFINADVSSKEPFRLTLFGESASRRAAQNDDHHLHFNASLNAAEAKARDAYRPAPNALRKNVIMIVVDALRPDHMALFGYARPTTPYLSSLAKDGRLSLVRDLHASCSESACGLSSLATSRYVHQMPRKPITLQEVLQRQGYRVDMILGGDHTNFYNLREIYGQVDSYFDGSMAKGYYMNDDSLIIDRTRALAHWDGVPTMLQFHLMSAHTLGKRLDRFDTFQPSHSYAGKASGDPAVEYTNHYDNGVLQADDTIRELLEALRQKGFLQSALVVITADHGESLGEHGLFAHANSVREEVLRVPLLVIDTEAGHPPEAKASTFDEQIDIAPTILHALRMAIPASWVGHPLQAAGGAAPSPELSFFQLKPNLGLYDLRQPGRTWKYWVDTNNGDEFAFDLAIDAHEQTNLIWQVPLPLRHEWRRTAYSTQTD